MYGSYSFNNINFNIQKQLDKLEVYALYTNKVKSANVKSVLHDYAKKHILVGSIAKYYVA